jgi:hypothetical protein
MLVDNIKILLLAGLAWLRIGTNVKNCVKAVFNLRVP